MLVGADNKFANIYQSYGKEEMDSYALFNNPTLISEHDTIIDHVIGLIENTPKGAWIRAGLYSITQNRVRNALRDAACRGVVVRVVADEFGQHNMSGQCAWSPDGAVDKCINYDDITWLTDQFSSLKNGNNASCEAVVCNDCVVHRCGLSGSGQACISSSSNSIQHQKYFMFSTTYHPETLERLWRAVFVTSSNMTHTASHSQWNDAFVSYGDLTWYESWKQHFNNQLSESKTVDYYDPGLPSGYFQSNETWYTAFFSPNSGENKNSDLLYMRLREGRIPGGGEQSDGCKLYVNQGLFRSERMAVANELIRIRNLGCDVRLIYNAIDLDVLGWLTYNDVSTVRVGLTGESTDYDYTHSKYIIYNGVYDGILKTRVWLGSHNLTKQANYDNDEVIVKVGDAKIYNSYENHFLSVWARFQPSWPSDH